MVNLLSYIRTALTKLESIRRTKHAKSTSREHNNGTAKRNSSRSRKREVEVMPNQRPEAVANEFLSLAGGQGLTQLQLQKLVYIAHGWTLAFCGEPLTASEPEAWERGPVYRGLREKISHSGSKPVVRKIHENDSNPFAIFASEDRGNEILGNFTDTESKIIALVWGRYGHLHGFTLSDLTHQPDTPWYNTIHSRGKNAPIPNVETEAHYSKLAQELADSQEVSAN